MYSPWRRIFRRRRPRAPYGNLIAFMRRRLAEEPHDSRLRYSLAVHLGRSGQYREAIHEAERLLELHPGYPEAKRLLLGLKLNRLVRGGHR